MARMLDLAEVTDKIVYWIALRGKVLAAGPEAVICPECGSVEAPPPWGVTCHCDNDE